MSAVGIFSDSQGDLAAVDAALKLLASKGARRFIFAGGKYSDLDDWAKWKRDEAKAQVDYTDSDFLEDVVNHLLDKDPLDRPAAFGTAYELARAAEELARMSNKVIRTPEKGSLQYQDPNTPRKAVDMIGDTLCCVVHDKNDLEKDDLINALLLVHGNEPEPKLVQIGPRYFLTPGRLSGGPKQTVGLLELIEKQLKFSAFTLQGEVLISQQPLVVAQKKKKISVK